MTDEFNLVPTNNLEKHLDNILRAASGDEKYYAHVGAAEYHSDTADGVLTKNDPIIG